MNDPQNRRQFLTTMVAATGLPSILSAAQNAAQAPAPAPAAPKAAEAPLTRLPRTMAGIDALSAQQKTLIAAATASGCDAVAYYEAAPAGGFTLKDHIDLYPTKETQFALTTVYAPPSDEQMRAGSSFPIALRNEMGEVQGIVVVQPPREGWGRVQTVAEAATGEDFHEPLAARKAKYEMASHIVAHGQDALLAGGNGFSAAAGGKPAGFADKQQYFKTLREDFINILGAEGSQAKHVTGVSDLMMLATDVINADKPIIGEPQKALLKDVTVLHDVGKLQMSVTFLNQNWRKGAAEPEKEAANHYDQGQNHNHPLFTRLILGDFPTEALTTAAHHHGLLRYTDKELSMGLGEDYARYKLLEDNVPFDKLPALSKFMRVCDVTEAMTGRGNKPVAVAIEQLASKAGYDSATKTTGPVTHDCNSIDPDYLCTLIEGGMFKKYGQMRTQQREGWKDPNGAAKYNEAAVEKISAEVLEAFHWKERGPAIAANLREQVAQGDFVQGNRSVGRSI